MEKGMDMTISSNQWDAIAKEVVELGLSLTEAADLAGAGYDQTRSAMKRRGITCMPETGRSIRDKVDRMKAQEAVDYLLGVVGALLEVKALDFSQLPKGVGGLTQQEARVFQTLLSVSPMPMEYSAIMSAVFHDRHYDEWPEPKIISVVICKLRRKMQGSGYKIATVWGRGFRLEREDWT